MSDPISPLGSQGQVPQVVTGSTAPAASRPAGGQDGSGSAVASVPAVAPKLSVGQVMPDATKLELSPGATPDPPLTPPKAMNVAEAAQAFQEYLKNLPSDLQFQPDSASGIVVFKVVNPITQKVIRQYPPEEMLELARSLRQSMKKEAAGILLDHNL